MYTNHQPDNEIKKSIFTAAALNIFSAENVFFLFS
jgi:hypothetical protein